MSKYEENEVKEKKVRKIDIKKATKIAELIIFIVMIILASFLSGNIAKIILATGEELLTRIVNVILVALVVAAYFYDKKK